MKRFWRGWFMNFLIGLGLLGVPEARAQLIGTSVGIGAGPQGAIHVNLALSVRNAVLIGGYGIDARLLGDLGPFSALELDGLLNVPVGDFTLYGGPGAALALHHTLNLRPTFTLGGSYIVDSQIGLFGEVGWNVSSGVRVRTGLTYSF
ncbi:hypothetical protein MF271_04555 [Deinococcus sp. KNUC1210]|uniref:hypothetical protein n=1 Tax=Deinococcus sp. KNUC1210 TaxID=2917691 RepID=UPI001EF075DB|nr:hypothetical protein [Deinococcus sp. KNUC1210]ULH15905.1 hypothetical protein MF271_04555 [Deinococcus sp. KNUC1210]